MEFRLSLFRSDAARRRPAGPLPLQRVRGRPDREHPDPHLVDVTCRPAPSRRPSQPHPITPSKERTMYDHKMNRMTARVTFGRPAPTEDTADLITSVPPAAEAAERKSVV